MDLYTGYYGKLQAASTLYISSCSVHSRKLRIRVRVLITGSIRDRKRAYWNLSLGRGRLRNTRVPADNRDEKQHQTCAKITNRFGRDGERRIGVPRRARSLTSARGRQTRRKGPPTVATIHHRARPESQADAQHAAASVI